MSSGDKEACPKCGRVHERADYKEQKEPKVDGGVVYAPPDIDCPCGVALRWVVPIFKTTDSGYELHLRKDGEVPYV